MKLATLRHNDSTFAVRVDDNHATVIDGFPDLSALLTASGWKDLARNASGESINLDTADYAPVVPSPGKIICVGLNYKTHIEEMGRDIPEYPTLFAKFKEALAGPYDDVLVPKYAAAQLDFEGELAFVIGRQASRVTAQDADSYIAGYSVMNDYTMRDYQYRTLQWDQGKSFEKTSGFGPFLTTTDSYSFGGTLQTTLDAKVMQKTTTDDLVFTPAMLVEYISHIVTLQPGDVVSTGTPGGVGHARSPRVYIQHGQVVEVSVEGLGAVRNRTIVVD